MATEIRVPTLGESVTEATVGQWFKKVGEAVKADEPLVELETDKVTLEVNAPADGVLTEITVKEGETVGVGALLGTFNEGGAGSAAAPRPAAAPAPAPVAPAPAPAAPAAAGLENGPAVQRIAAETGISPAGVPGTGKDGRVTKGDILAFAAAPAQAPAAVPAPVATPRAPAAPGDEAREERVRMTKLRQTIARRLKEAQSNAAMLTTFNDVDMTNVIELRNQYKDAFEKKHGVKLGFMGFFVKAAVQALKELPAVNAELDGTDLIYKNYYHIGVAVGTDKGLVVPVVRDADQLSVAGIEQQIGDFGRRARDGQLKIEEMQGGTFTISNGGVYGSLLSTPILNAPQSAILGMHRIDQRPVVYKGQIVARPIMFLALSYDHRVIDGKEAVTFLVRIKENLQDPARLVLDL
ncbi:2-oxoglutarate dehydrogenase E2 component (dihydrolipoamide succinyltransferase) [Pseudochelatococcus lubricantis]|uniref:Dihydrolipoyllysine-residue succinyltransferase component of 2-oxoglutarate dehydrogenase complex n=1 Tax=Pseudochelatococcus lubricantis TaxID=1538102 RepID=A0ABX0UVN2_9HYPH|nr:2-oxoglutarate dehydrogenase complex dihydrolipoyllysine-residue succinyltransferase [Pseudochelatococcus lubricantis]NIJ57018.1 2-oxoglutarate dehydrogenase E2 component (dihydrolipoamide succinyltransferase) [Pseudochelatococcus lubricantis]